MIFQGWKVSKVSEKTEGQVCNLSQGFRKFPTRLIRLSLLHRVGLTALTIYKCRYAAIEYSIMIWVTNLMS